MSWRENGNTEYKTRTEWHRVICRNKLADWAGNLQKGAYVEVEGELRYREYTLVESDRSMRVAEIDASSTLALDRSAAQPPLNATRLTNRSTDRILPSLRRDYFGVLWFRMLRNPYPCDGVALP